MLESVAPVRFDSVQQEVSYEGQWLHAADLPGRPGRAETTYLALSELCARLSQSTDLSSAETRAEVKGAARVLSTLVPGLSSQCDGRLSAHAADVDANNASASPGLSKVRGAFGRRDTRA